MELLGISIAKRIGVGDALQFSSLPENYYRATKKPLVDVSHHWFFDHNPYVIRNEMDSKGRRAIPNKTIELWNFGPKQWDWPRPRPQPVYVSNAEIWASLLQVPVVLNRPRLYKFEEFPYAKREKILIQTQGISHGKMPDHIIEHVLKKYKGMPLYHIGKPTDADIGIPKLNTPTLWDLAKEISEAKMYIGVDSGPSWIAACYPDVILKKVRMKPTPEHFKTWVPLLVDNIHSHWDDRLAQIHNPTEDDIGFTMSYRRI